MSIPAAPALPTPFERYRSEIQAELRNALDGLDQPLYDMLRYHFGWREADGSAGPGPSGKGLRPTLCLLVSDALSGSHGSALPAAAALELVHNFSLVHDDIQDGDGERHHRATVWSVFGKPQAINAGTAMYALASLLLARLEGRDVAAERLLAALRLTHASCLRLIEGQFLDIDFEDRLDVTVDDYLTMIAGKTAALISCSTGLGALLSGDGEASCGADDATVARFLEMGEHLGLAFQVRDDMLGVWGDSERTGKPVGADITARKKTFPIVDALDRAEGAQRETLRALYGSDRIDEDGRDAVLAILDELGTRQRAERLAEMHLERALAAVDGLTLQPGARADLEQVARFLTERDH